LKPSIIVLTYNSETSIGATLESVAALSDDIHIVDSCSTDRTVEIALVYGARVIRHAFENYGAQRNWAISTLPIKYSWQLHLDADERVTPELLREISRLDEQVHINGFFIPRIVHFMGRPIRHGGMFPTWHMRLFRSGCGKCEVRKYDQHFYVGAGETAQLRAHVIDDIRMSLGEWTSRHNRWSEAEVEEQSQVANEGRIAGRFLGNRIEKKRFWRKLYNQCPLFVRPFVLFFYRYIVRLGFLDGTTGLIFYVLQTFWFRFLVDSKLFEKRLDRMRDSGVEPAAPASDHLNSHTSNQKVLGIAQQQRDK
jgi:glycosyltransferase involved in cell wall biosynthesis